MIAFSYRTIKAQTEGLYKEKGSKFLAFAIPAATSAAVKETISKLKKEYFDARHHCYAYVLGADKKQFRAVDDGEPNHSAGDPILRQIRSRNLTNILIVVIRYFGGVKLGVGGLINAYREAAEDALVKATFIEKDVMELLSFQFDYTSTPEMMRLIKEFDLTVLHQEYADTCSLTTEVKLKNKVELIRKIELLQALSHPIWLKQIG